MNLQQQKWEESNNQLSQSNEENEKLKADMKNIMEKSKKLETDLKQVRQNNEEMKQQVKSKDASLDKYKNDEIESQKRIQATQAELTASKKQCSDLTQERTKLQTSHAEEMKNYLKKGENDAVKFKDEVDRLDAELKKHHAELESEKAKNAQLESDIDGLHKRMFTQIMKKDKVSETETATQNELNALAEQFGTVSQELKQCKADKDKETEAYELKLKEEAATVTSLKSKNMESEAKINELMGKLTALDTEIAQFKNTNLENEKVINDMKLETAKTSQSMKDAGKDLESTKLLLEGERQTKKSLEEKCSGLETQNENLDEELKNVKFTKSKVERDNQLLEKKVNKKDSELKESKEECEGLSKKLKELQEDHDKIVKEKDRLSKEKENVSRVLHEKEAESEKKGDATSDELVKASSTISQLNSQLATKEDEAAQKYVSY